MLASDNGFTGSGVSVYGSLQMLLALATSVHPGPPLYYLHVSVCACVSVFVRQRAFSILVHQHLGPPLR